MAAAGLKDGSETCCDVWLGDTKTGIRIFIGSEHALKIEGAIKDETCRGQRMLNLVHIQHPFFVYPAPFGA